MNTSPLPPNGLKIRPMIGAQGFFIVLHLLWHRASGFSVLFEGLAYLVTSYDTQGDAEDLI
jgi:hypothetical protein